MGVSGAPWVPMREDEPQRPRGRGHQGLGRQAPGGHGRPDIEMQVHAHHDERPQEGERPQPYCGPSEGGREAVPPGPRLGHVQPHLHEGSYGRLRRHGHPGHRAGALRWTVRQALYARPRGRVPGRLSDPGRSSEVHPL